MNEQQVSNNELWKMLNILGKQAEGAKESMKRQAIATEQRLEKIEMALKEVIDGQVRLEERLSLMHRQEAAIRVSGEAERPKEQGPMPSYAPEVAN